MTNKKLISLLMALVLLLSLVLVACEKDNGDVDHLIVYNWADYIYDYEEEFAQYYSELTGREIEVTYVTFDTNETMLTRLMRGDSKVDVICPSEYAIQQLLEADMLQPINYFTDDSFVNSSYVNSDIVDKVAETFDGIKVGDQTVDFTQYFVPYMYGTIGIMYNVDIIEQEGLTAQDIYNAGWGAMFNKDSDGNKLSSSLDNRIFMKDSVRDAYAAVVCYLYESGALANTPYANMNVTQLINTVDDAMIQLVKTELLAQKDVLYGYEVDFGKNDLIMGNAYLDLAWSGDALYAIDESRYVVDNADGTEEVRYALDYYVPKTSNIWFDGWVIPKSAANVEPAKIFIDFLNSPYVAAQNMLEIGYSSAVNKQDILDDEDAMAVLYEAYNAYAPEYWTPQSEDGGQWEYDFESAELFRQYFFSDIRYPDINDEYYGVMRHFGDRNTAVSMMWETVRSTGISAWGLLGYTLLAFGTVIGIIYLAYYINKRKKLFVKVAPPSED